MSGGAGPAWARGRSGRRAGGQGRGLGLAGVGRAGRCRGGVDAGVWVWGWRRNGARAGGWSQGRARVGRGGGVGQGGGVWPDAEEHGAQARQGPGRCARAGSLEPGRRAAGLGGAAAWVWARARGVPLGAPGMSQGLAGIVGPGGRLDGRPGGRARGRALCCARAPLKRGARMWGAGQGGPGRGGQGAPDGRLGRGFWDGGAWVWITGRRGRPPGVCGHGGPQAGGRGQDRGAEPSWSGPGAGGMCPWPDLPPAARGAGLRPGSRPRRPPGKSGPRAPLRRGCARSWAPEIAGLRRPGPRPRHAPDGRGPRPGVGPAPGPPGRP